MNQKSLVTYFLDSFGIALSAVNIKKEHFKMRTEILELARQAGFIVDGDEIQAPMIAVDYGEYEAHIENELTKFYELAHQNFVQNCKISISEMKFQQELKLEYDKGYKAGQQQSVNAELLAALKTILPWHDAHPIEVTDNPVINQCRQAIANAEKASHL